MAPSSPRVNNVQAPQEDCLYLNVWTQEWPDKPPRPVMVYIHCGGNLTGASSVATYEGESLARHRVVLVSLNYRLGVFGFFSHPALTRESLHQASGNQGILDQIAALKWVHENAASFSGDANIATNFGESAGSLDVSVLMTSPLAQGLFRRVIAQSGSVVKLGDPLTLLQAEARGEKTVASWKIPARASLKELRAVSAADILQAEQITLWRFGSVFQTWVSRLIAMFFHRCRPNCLRRAMNSMSPSCTAAIRGIVFRRSFPPQGSDQGHRGGIRTNRWQIQGIVRGPSSTPCHERRCNSSTRVRWQKKACGVHTATCLSRTSSN